MWEESRLHDTNFDTGEDPALALRRAELALEHECDEFDFMETEDAEAEGLDSNTEDKESQAARLMRMELEAREEESLHAEMLDQELDHGAYKFPALLMLSE